MKRAESWFGDLVEDYNISSQVAAALWDGEPCCAEHEAEFWTSPTNARSEAER